MDNDALKHPIRSLPVGEDEGIAPDVQVQVVPMTYALAAQWHTQVQPLIDAHFVHASKAGGDQRVRADVGWDWPKQLLLAGLHTRLMRLVHGPAQALCLVVDTAETGVFPIGMLTIVPLMSCTAFGEERRRGFGWFLSDAPRQAYTELLGSLPVRTVAPALLDCGIQATLDLGEDGTFLLHADPNGGEHLADFYVRKIGMQRLPEDSAPITPGLFRRFVAPAQYFHFDQVQAERYCLRFDPRR